MMLLEVLIQGEKSLLYPLNRSRLVIGSSKACDIRVQLPEISRKHIVLIVEDEKILVVDQGSSNGSYIGEEMITPNVNVEFSTFFQIRLGYQVFLALRTEEETVGKELSPLKDMSEKTSSLIRRSLSQIKIEVEDLTKTVSDKLKKRELMDYQTQSRKLELDFIAEKKKVQVTPKKKAETKNVPIYVAGAVLLLVLGYFYQTAEQAIPESIPEPTPVAASPVRSTQKVTTPDAVPSPGPALLAAPEPEEEIKLVEKSKLPSKDSVRTLLYASKCSKAVEKHVCEIIKESGANNWGVSAVENRLTILIDGANYTEVARKLLPKPSTPEEGASFEHDLRLIATALAIQQKIYAPMDDEMLKGYDITIALFETEGEKTDLFSVAVMPYAGFKAFKAGLDSDKIENIYKYRAKGFKYTEKFLRLY
ncbi:MAG TPA: FHA domain-containing protein [Bacteriovoracaceae bacterium]|nr:FHA domain-containing protein [Bacteriovoracaceae bacterium]